MRIADKLACAFLAAGIAAAAPQLAHARSFYTTIGGTENGGDPLAAAGPYLLDEVGPNKGQLFQSIILRLAVTAADKGHFDLVYAEADQNGLPTNFVVFKTISDTRLTTKFANYQFRGDGSALDPTKLYYFGVAAHAGESSNVVLGNTLDPEVLARPPVAAGQYYYNNGGVQANAGGPYELRVNTTTNPIP